MERLAQFLQAQPAHVADVPSPISAVVNPPSLAQELFGVPVSDPPRQRPSRVKQMLENRLHALVPSTMTNRQAAVMLENAAHGDSHDELLLGVNTGIQATATTVVLDCVASVVESHRLARYVDETGISGAPQSLAENAIHGRMVSQVHEHAHLVAERMGMESTPLMTVVDTGDGCMVTVPHRVVSPTGETIWSMQPEKVARFSSELARSLALDTSKSALDSLCVESAQSIFGISPPRVNSKRRVVIATHPVNLIEPHGNLETPGSFHIGLSKPSRFAEAAKCVMPHEQIVTDEATAVLLSGTYPLSAPTELKVRDFGVMEAWALRSGLPSETELPYHTHDAGTMTTSVPPDRYDEATTVSVPPFFESEIGGNPNQADAIAVDGDPYGLLAVNLLSQPRAFKKVFGVLPFRYLEGAEPEVKDLHLLERARGRVPRTPSHTRHLKRIG